MKFLKKNDMINSMKRELSNINKRLEDEEKIDEISEGIVENALAEEKEKGIDTVNYHTLLEKYIIRIK